MLRRISPEIAAAKAGISVRTLKQHVHNQRITRSLAGFPEPCIRQPRLLWLESDVDAWLIDQSTYTAKQAPVDEPMLAPAKIGRRRKQ